MRGIWIDAGDDPLMRKLTPRQIRRAYFAAAVDDGSGSYIPNPRLNRAYLDGWRTAIGGVGIYRASSWPVNGRTLTAAELAEQLDADLTRIGANDRQCEVHLNAEAHDFDLLAYLSVWRRWRPNRETSWIIEGLQGGRLTMSQVLAINDDINLRVLAESFYDDGGRSMLPYSPDAVRANLIDYGIMRQRALVMYDAADLGAFWDGCAFTQGRVPA